MPNPSQPKDPTRKGQTMEDSPAFITNISFPKSLEEVLYFMKVRGKLDMEDLIESTYVEWTAPKSAAPGDMVFFMHSVTSIDTIKRLKRELKKYWLDIPDGDRALLEAALARGASIYEQYGAKIFATGRVCGDIIEDTIARDDGLHWRSIYYAPIDSIQVLECPIDISEFRSFIKVSRTGAITKLDSTQVEELRKLLDR